MNKMKAPILKTTRLILKPLNMEHLTEDYVGWLNDEEVYRYLETGGNYNKEMLEDYLKAVVKKDIYFWAIHIKENDLHIGNVKIDPINCRHGWAEYGIMMGKKSEWGKGYAKEATLKVIDFCFNKLQIRKITLGVVADNISAVSLYRILGFNQEGLYKKQGLYANKYCDIIRMALFNPSFEYNDK
jgi:ribosomal-protein-alanine N-acetyltransferase